MFKPVRINTTEAFHVSPVQIFISTQLHLKFPSSLSWFTTMLTIGDIRSLLIAVPRTKKTNMPTGPIQPVLQYNNDFISF